MPEYIIASEAPEQADEELWPEEEDSDPTRPPVALLSVTRALHRNWQVVDQAPRQPSDVTTRSTASVQPPLDERHHPPFEDEHYLSMISEKLIRSASPDTDTALLAEIWRLVTRRTEEQWRSVREVRQLLAGEIEKFAHLLPRQPSPNTNPGTRGGQPEPPRP